MQSSFKTFTTIVTYIFNYISILKEKFQRIDIFRKIQPGGSTFSHPTTTGTTTFNPRLGDDAPELHGGGGVLGFLVGGWTNPFEKKICNSQIGLLFPQVSKWKSKIFELPPPRFLLFQNRNPPFVEGIISCFCCCSVVFFRDGWICVQGYLDFS